MRNNIQIVARERGKITSRRVGHNVWVDAGNQYLSQILELGGRSDRLRYIGLGIGGVDQHDPAADASPFSDTYPAGFDPHATDGHRYNKDYPIDPNITTLERPIKIRGTQDPYDVPDPNDEWLTILAYPTHPSLTTTTVRAPVNATLGEVVLAGWTYVPLSEVGLFTSDAVMTEPFNPLLAYFSFDTIQMTPDTVIDIIWNVRF